LAAHGTEAYAEAMEQTLVVAQQAAQLVRNHPHLELLCDPELSIVAFTRKGWVATDYQKWSDQLLEDQVGFIPPSSHHGQPILRFAIVNPWTKISDISMILERL
jgi:glutamate/tyrosine decarboxylase-like PLP-dependent enzyme